MGDTEGNKQNTRKQPSVIKQVTLPKPTFFPFFFSSLSLPRSIPLPTEFPLGHRVRNGEQRGPRSVSQQVLGKGQSSLLAPCPQH
jgi:hypothetical protein